MANDAFTQCLVLQVVLPQNGVAADWMPWRVKRLMVLVLVSEQQRRTHMGLISVEGLSDCYPYTMLYSLNTRSSVSQSPSLDPARV